MKKPIKTLAAVAVGVSAALGLATPAQATPLSYIQALNDHGLQVYNADLALQWGAAICSALNTTNGEMVAVNFYNNTNWDVPDMFTAKTIVMLAAENLCPWNDHRGQMRV